MFAADEVDVGTEDPDGAEHEIPEDEDDALEEGGEGGRKVADVERVRVYADGDCDEGKNEPGNELGGGSELGWNPDVDARRWPDALDGKVSIGGGLTSTLACASVMTGGGWRSDSRKLMKGISALRQLGELTGELGNGRWMMLLALGGGRSGTHVCAASLSETWPSSATQRSTHRLSSISICSSAALRCAAVGNGTKSWQSMQIS